MPDATLTPSVPDILPTLSPSLEKYIISSLDVLQTMFTAISPRRYSTAFSATGPAFSLLNFLAGFRI